MRDYFNTKSISKPYCKFTIMCGEIKSVKLAIVIPTFKRLNLLKRCVLSITKQTYEGDFQIIISDNDPETKTRWEMHNDEYSFFSNHPNIVYCVNERNIGGGNNCNQAVILASSKYICMVHDDDVLNCHHLELLMDVIQSQSNIDYLCSQLTYLNPFKEKINIDSFCNSVMVSKGVIAQKVKLNDMFCNYSCHMLGAIIDREKYLEIGGLEDQCVMEDYIFSTNFVRKYGVFVYDIRTYGYCIQENDSLNTSVWEKIICEQYLFRKFLYPKIFKGGSLKRWLVNRKYLIRDIAIRESKKNIIKMRISRKYIKKQLKIHLWDVNIIVSILKFLIRVNIL